MRCILRFLEELMAPLVVDIFFFFSFFFLLPLLHGHSGILVPFAIYGTFETLFFSRRLFRFTFDSLAEESIHLAD